MNGLAGIAVTYIKEVSCARREAAVWRELLLQALRILGPRDRELREAFERLSDDQRELLEQGIHEFGCGDRELLMLTLSLLDRQGRRSTHRGIRRAA